MNIVGLLRVKNEERWIRESLLSLVPICSKIFMLDDGSIDRTAAIARDIPNVEVIVNHRSDLNEPRDKEFLFGYATKRSKFDWAVMIDGDEALEKSAPGTIFRELTAANRQGAPRAFALPIVYLWDRPDQWRVDGIYRTFKRPSVFRVDKTDGKWQRSGYGGGFHCSNVPFDMQAYASLSDCRVLHYGYMDRADRIRKHTWYNARDPHNEHEDRYRHMILGDVPEFPAELKTKWAGPLELEPL